MARDRFITLRLSAEVFAILERLANEQDVTKQLLLTSIIVSWLKAQGEEISE